MEKINFYEKARIYKIVDNTNQNIYIGSTCKTLAQRLGQHRADYKRFLNEGNNNVTSFEIIKNGNYNIYLIEEFSCENIEQLRARERFFIESMECVNRYIPGRTKHEYYENNKELMKEKQKKYHDNNLEYIQKYMKKYREDNKEYSKTKIICNCGGKFTLSSKSIHYKTKKHITFYNNKLKNINI